MKIYALFAAITMFSMNSLANVSISCTSKKGTIQTEQEKASIDYASFLVEGNEVYVAYLSPLFGLTFSNEMKKLDDLTFYKVQRGECFLLECLLPSSIQGYDVFEFEFNQDNGGMTLKQHFIDSPSQNLSKENLRKHLTVEAFLTTVVETNTCN